MTAAKAARAGKAVRAAARLTAPAGDRWAAVSGRIAVYSFLVALISGVLLLPFFRPDMTSVVYHGSYRKLDGVPVSKAYQSVLGISFDVRGGLLIRQVHHWSADLFVAAIILRLLRAFFRGRFSGRALPGWLIWVALEVRLNTTIEEVTDGQVRLSDGTTVPTRTLAWCVGVTPGPLTQALGLDTIKGRIVVDEYLTVPGHPDVLAADDAAAAPDLTRPGQLTAMTAQHAQRQGKAAARNVAATLGHRTRKPYKHRDLGFVVDLGGWQAVANPLHIPVSGPPANLITRAYHLYALPANRLRIATDWLNDIIEHRQLVQLGLIPSQYSGLTAAEHTDIYYQTDGQPLNHSLATEHPQGTTATHSRTRVM